MSHPRTRDRVEDELFGRMAPKEEDEDMAQTKRTRRIVEATKRLLMENPTLTADELHTRLSRNGASLPKVESFRPYATQARKELGIDGRGAQARAGRTDLQGEDPAGASEAGAEDVARSSTSDEATEDATAPAPPAEEERVEINRGVKISQRGKVSPESKEEMAALQEEADERMSRLEKPDQEKPTPERPSNEAQAKLKRTPLERNAGATPSFPGVAPSVDRLYFKAHRLEDGRYQIDASGPLRTIQRMVAALDGED